MWSNDSNISCSPSSSSTTFKIAAALRGCSSIVSFVLAVFAVVLNVLLKKYLVPLQRMVLYYGVTSVLTGISKTLNRVDYFVENQSTRAFCVWAGFFDEYASWATILSSLGISYYLMVNMLERPDGGKRAIRFWFLLIFIFPLTFCWIPFIYLAYGQSADWAWCSLRRVLDDCTTFVFAMVLGYVIWFIPAFFVVALTVAMYIVALTIVLRRRIRRSLINCHPDVISKHRQVEREVLFLMLPLLGLVFSNSLSILVSITESFKMTSVPLWMAYAVLTPLFTGGLIPLILTVDKTSCSMLMRRSILKGNSIKQYDLNAADPADTGTLPREKTSK